MMKNRFGVEIKKGLYAVSRGTRGGKYEGRITSLQTRGAFVTAYGKQVTLDDALTVGIDDIIFTAKRWQDIVDDRSTMLKRTNPISKHVKTHLLRDIDEAARGIERDLKLMKNPRKRSKYKSAYHLDDTAPRDWKFYVENGVTKNPKPVSWLKDGTQFDAELKRQEIQDRLQSKGMLAPGSHVFAKSERLIAKQINPAKHRAIIGVHRVEWSSNGREWQAVHGLRNLNKTTAVAAAKQIHKHAPHMHVKVVP